MAEQLSGSVERVTFHNPETGYAVLRVCARARPGRGAMVPAFYSSTATQVMGRVAGMRIRAHRRLDMVALLVGALLVGGAAAIGAVVGIGVGLIHAYRESRTYERTKEEYDEQLLKNFYSRHPEERPKKGRRRRDDD